jgi:RHS repeat-associated protein
LIALSLPSGTVVERYAYDPWGKRRNPTNWTQTDTRTAFILNRGYTMHEHLPEFNLINMNGRVYDPLTAMFFSPDPYLQAPGNWLNYNRYGYCLNNPFLYTDPDGEIVWFIPVIIGAIVGAYSGGVIANDGQYNPFKWDYSSGKTWGYMLGGAVVDGISGYAGWAIAGSGIPMANTAAIAGSSLINSVGTWAYTGGQTPISISFGIASYDFTNNEWGYLGKKGNKWYENLGYGLGALANAADILAGFKPGDVTLRTENDPNYSPKGDPIGHSQLSDANGNNLIDWGPTENKTSLLGLVEGTNSYEQGQLIPNLKGSSFWNPVDIKGVNVDRIMSFSNYLNQGGKYNLLYNNCVSMTSRALNMSGVFNIGIHPYLLHAQMYLRSIGVRPMLYSHFLLNH